MKMAEVLAQPTVYIRGEQFNTGGGGVFFERIVCFPNLGKKIFPRKSVFDLEGKKVMFLFEGKKVCL